MRFVDDYLFVTESKQEAVDLLEFMKYGFEDYGGIVNMAKTLVNFDVVLDGKPVTRLKKGGHGELSICSLQGSKTVQSCSFFLIHSLRIPLVWIEIQYKVMLRPT